MFKIIYYRNKCIGCGIRYEQQPGLWRMSKKDVFVLSVSNTIQQRTQEVARDCPVKIIKVL